MTRANAEVERAAGRVTSLEKERDDAKAKAASDADAAYARGMKDGEEKAVDDVSPLLDAGLSKRAAGRLTHLCDMTMKKEKKKLNEKLEQLRNRLKKRPSDKLRAAMADVEMQLAVYDKKDTCLVRRQRVRRMVSQRRWSVAAIILFVLLIAAMMVGMKAKSDADGYKRTLIAVASDGLHGSGSLSKDIWNDILNVYNDEFGTTYSVGR